MAGFTEKIARSNVPIPEEISTEIIKEVPTSSIALQRARRARMTTKTFKQPVLDSLPDAYWLNADDSLKQTTHVEWGNLIMTAEELAVLVPIPNAVIDDSSMPIWDEVRPLLVEAIGRKVDLASIWGIDKPASWPVAIVPAAVAAGNIVTAGTDIGQDAAKIAGVVAEDGFDINGFVGKAGFRWKVLGLRDTVGQPIYDSQNSALYGLPLDEAENGTWQATTPATELIAVDWTKQVIGIRQDITFDLFDQMVISDADGKVVFNSAQQDSRVLRVVFRVGFQTANPLTRVNPVKASRYPAGVIRATA